MSYSTFSSSSESAYVCSDSFSSLDAQADPLGPFTGHAFVYHAKVPRKNECCRKREKKNNPNCFVKAFRWYTQEHKVTKNRRNDKSDLNEFAVWLDQKYDQFLYDNQRNRILSSVRIAPNQPYNPFRKCRRAADCHNGGDGSEKCNQSFEVIMQAKELSRPASECCFQNRLASCCNSSKVTVASSDTVVIKKWSKFKKASWENQDNELRITPEPKVMEIAEINEKAAILFPQNISLTEGRYSYNKLANNINFQCQCPEELVIITETSRQCGKCKYQNEAETIQPNVVNETEARRPSLVSKFSARVQPSNEKNNAPSCRDPKCVYSKAHGNIDNYTQYSHYELTPATALASCECPVSKPHIKLETEKVSSHEKMRSNTRINKDSWNNGLKNMCMCTLGRREHDLCHKWVFEEPVTTLASDTAQTSDHSIVLDNSASAIGGFPLLVRIVAP